MKSAIAAVAMATACLAACEAAAQMAPEAVPASQVAEAAPPAAAAVPAGPVIASGTPIRIEVAETVSTKTHRKGDVFAIRLAAPILYDGKVIVPAGVPGQGQIVDSARAGIGGAPSKLVLAARWIEYDGKRIPVRTFRFASGGENRSNLAMAISLAPYVGIVGIFITGGEITIQPGAVGDAKLAADVPAIPIPEPAPAPAPVTEPAPAGPATAAPAAPIAE
jgi:hypothetical protein